MVKIKKPEENPFSIRDIAIKVLREKLETLIKESDSKEKAIFVFGSKRIGKTSAIGTFFEKEEPPRPTLALEYFFVRRSSSLQGIQNQILNIWELNCLENSEKLIDVPLRMHGSKYLSMIYFVDLSQPNRLWRDLDNGYINIKNLYKNLLKETELADNLEKANERIGKEHPDRHTLDLFPFPIVIVGGKYDIFMNFDPELKKHVCRYLRSVAHILGASLLFYSNKIGKLSKTIRDTISCLGFGSPVHPFRSLNVDYNEAITVWFGSDTWDQIGSRPLTMEAAGLSFCQAVPQVKIEDSNSLTDPANDSGFREILIDEIRAQKNEELAAIVKQNQTGDKFQIIDNFN